MRERSTTADTAEAIACAANLLRLGELVAFPTETVYGLGGDAANDAAVAAIFEAKGRPRFNPLIVHLPGLPEAEPLSVFDQRAREVAARFWPGPLTLVLPRRPGCPVSLLASAGLDTLALRVPAHPIAQVLLRAIGRPVVAPSANRSGRVSPTTAAHVTAELGDRVAMVLDGGACEVGLESTVLDLTDTRPVLLRPGGVPFEALEAALGEIELAPPNDDATPHSPGRLPSHYAPGLPVRLDATSARPGEALLAFGTTAPEGFAEILWLSRAGELREASANLFAMLRQLDRPEFAGIAVMPIPETGLGRAINDRLRRAAAPRR
ncbi:MAG: threonylcarbamoyl-AMP synthase [Alphaproteobacteria bacterium]|nr:threonylcarbamoyl-AMP synthase [Alphaproteobacteria bacterium]